MIERLHVAPGAGTVIRYGAVTAWAETGASPALISFLAASARNLAASPTGGRHLAEHLAGVLRERDPEPEVAFATVGPASEGWIALLHGRVQLWDGTSWFTPESDRKWMQSPVSPRTSMTVTPAGSPLPSLSPDAVGGLEAGVVPGGGFLLVPASVAVSIPASAGEEAGLAAARPGAGPSGTAGPGASDEELRPVGERGSSARPDDSAESLFPSGSPAASPGGGLATPLPEGTLDLRSGDVLGRVVTHPPLPPVGDSLRPLPGAPTVPGVVCGRGHFNRPGMTACARCGTRMDGAGSVNVTGGRPALGCLVVDDGHIYRLDGGYLVGSEPGGDPTVRGGLARPLLLEGQDVASNHAELRLHDWDVVVTDRAAPGGTHVYGPDASSWERLRPYAPRVLEPGSHVAFGQRVVTFLSPWVTGPAS